MKANKFLKDRSGIYGIRNVLNGKIYIGQTRCMYRRCHQYIHDFNNRTTGHLNDYLYNAMIKVGIHNFEFFPLQFCSIESLQTRELYWITKLKSLDRNNGYNLRSDTTTGMEMSLSTRVKISKNLTRQWKQGVRSDHSSKMKRNWKSNPQRRKQQSTLMSKVKTKYEYSITDGCGVVTSNVTYANLRERGLHNVIASFHRKCSNVVNHKGFTIERMPRGES